METVIKIQLSELNIELLNKIREFIGSKENIDVTISLKEYDLDYSNTLNKSMEETNQENNLVTLTMEEFISYSPKKKWE